MLRGTGTLGELGCVTCCEDTLMDDRDVYLVLLQEVEEAPRGMHSADAVRCAEERHHCFRSLRSSAHIQLMRCCAIVALLLRPVADRGHHCSGPPSLRTYSSGMCTTQVCIKCVVSWIA